MIRLDGRPHDPRRALQYTYMAALGREDPEARCLPPGVPRMSMTPYPWSFVQTPKEIDAAGIPHSTDMKVVERITRTDFGRMEIVHTVDDPKTISSAPYLPAAAGTSAARDAVSMFLIA
jgi:hypothetical protein